MADSRYEVVVTFEGTSWVDVEAESEDAAKEYALETWRDGDLTFDDPVVVMVQPLHGPAAKS